ncbi:MAG: choice-of-anchor I family protein [Cytophagales bacterium]|nr:choice-of-anchor I family protein [Cytophagales bacterium]
MKKLLSILLLVCTVLISHAQLQLSAFSTTTSLGFNVEGGIAEITTYDPVTKHFFCINGLNNTVVEYDFSTPTGGAVISPVNLVSILGAGAINSIACHQGLLAVLYENGTDRTQNGFVQLYTTSGLATIGAPISVGAQPDMITFTPQGDKLLIANEGEPNQWYTVDPEGSISIINVSNPTSPTVQNINFNSLDGTIPHALTYTTVLGVAPAIIISGMINTSASGAGIDPSNIRIPSSVSQDLEPEYITVSPDGTKAWVSCQENNALLIIDVNTASIITIVGLGYKNHNTAGNGLDAGGTQNAAAVNIRTWPFKGVYMPDGIAVATIAGIPYIFSANEGDGREYRVTGPQPGTGGARSFRNEVDASGAFAARLNANVFSATGIATITATGMRFFSSLGAFGANPFLNNTIAGDNINAGNIFNELYTFGTRSFSIWNGNTGALVWDSGDQIERNVFNTYPAYFNTDHNGADNNARRRSPRKGPEPESIITGMIGDSLYAFVGLERMGGVMVFNVTNPNSPYFTQYINTRDFSVAPNSVAAGDLGPEGLTLIKPSESADGGTYLLVSNEVSGTVRIFSLNYKQNIVASTLKPFIVPANGTESPVQAMTLIGHNLTSPLMISSAPIFAFSLNSTTGFSTGGGNYTFSGNSFYMVVYVKYTDTQPYASGTISFSAGSGSSLTSAKVVGMKATTVVGASAYTLQLLHASDFEAGLLAMETAPKFAAIWDKFNGEYPNTLRVSGGDNFLPSPFFNAAADATLRPTFAAVNNGMLGVTNGANYREGIGRGDIQMMNLLDLHASAIGNHEFDAGTGTFAEMINVAFNDATAPTQIRWAGTRFPYLSCNLDFSADANLSGIVTNQIRPSHSYKIGPTQNQILALNPEQRKKIAPATVVTIGGEVIGIVGATTQIVTKISSTGAVSVIGTNVDDMPLLATQIQPQVDRLRAMGINKIVLLAHLQQIANEKALLPLLSGVDIIVAAGSHTLMSDADDNLEGDTQRDVYPYVGTDKDGVSTLLVSTESEYKYVGRLVIDFDMNGNVIPSSYVSSISGAWKASDLGLSNAGVNTALAFSSTLPGYLAKGIIEGINPSPLQPNAITLTGVSATTPGIRGIINGQDGTIFGKTQVYMEGRREGVRQQETNLGSVTADANLWYARSLGHKVMVSIKNGGGIRAALGVVSAVGSDFVNLPPLANAGAGKATGEISQLDISNSLRFNNGLTCVTVTAAQLLQIMNHSVAASTPTATPGQFAQIGGMRFSYDISLPTSSRVRSLAIVDSVGKVIDVVAVNGTVVGDAMRPIGMVTLNFMVNGGDSYPFPAFSAANSAFFNRMNVYTVPGAAPTLTFFDQGSEQIGFASYLSAAYPRTSVGYNIADTQPAQDMRIQNLSARTEDILPDMTMPIATITGTAGSNASIYAVSVFGTKLATPIWIHAPAGAWVNNMSMITVPGNGGLINVTALNTLVGTTQFTITLTAASLAKTFTHTLITTPRVATLTGVWTLTGGYLASVPALKIGDYTLGTVTSPIYEGGFSGLHYIPGTNGMEYYTLGDRGPNVEADAANGNILTKLFPFPTYAPKYHRIRLMGNNTISITSSVTFKRPGGTNLSGLVPSNTLGGSGEVAWDINRNTIAGDDFGIDCEGIVEGKMNDLWVCDEYGVNIWRFNKNDGSFINRYSPFGTVVGGNLPLPTDLQKKRANRGFEGVAVTPNGMIYALIQSPMHNPTSAVQSASRIHRLVQLNPATGQVKTYAYVNDGTKFATRPQDWKLGDLVAVNNHEFLVLEHTDRTPYSKFVYKIDISAASALTVTSGFVNGTATGLTLEQLNNAAGLSNNSIIPVAKTLVADLQDYGYDQNLGLDKPEGLTIIDATTIAVTNDNDFQVSSPNLDGNIVVTNKLCMLHHFKLQTPLNYQPVGATAMITFNGASLTVGGANVDLAARFMTNSSGTKSFSIASGNAASISGNNLVAVMAGTVTVTGMVASTTGFDAGMAMAVFTVSAAPVTMVNPMITFNGTSLTVGGANVDLAAIFTTNSSGTKSFMIASGNAASISGNNLVAVMAGSVTVTGMVASTTGYNSGSMMAVFNVSAAPVSISLSVMPSTLSVFTANTNMSSDVQMLTVKGTNVSGNVVVSASSGFEISTNATSGFASSYPFNSVEAASGFTLYVRMASSGSSGSVNGTLSLSTPGFSSSVVLSGMIMATPDLMISPTISGIFTGTSGNASAVQSFTVMGRNLTSNVTITATAGFEFRSLMTTLTGATMAGTDFVTTFEIVPTSGAFDDVWEIRLAATTVTGTFTGILSIMTAGDAIEGTLVGTNFITNIDEAVQVSKLTVSPNPANTGMVKLSKTVTYDLVNAIGVIVKSGANANEIEVTGLAKGIYVIKTSQGEIERLVVE